MGMKNSKSNSFNVSMHDYRQYGLTQQEIAVFENFFKSAAGKDGLLNQKEFMKLYSQMNPQIPKSNLQQYADRAFMATDLNHDGQISFDEFLFSYVLSKCSPNNFQSTMYNFLNAYTFTPGYLTPYQAYNYVYYLYNYYGVPTTLLVPEVIYTYFQNYGGFIPIESFVEYVYPLYVKYYV